MPYTNGDGTYHERRRCRQLHRTGNRIRRLGDTDGLDPCEDCVDSDEPEEPEPPEIVASDYCQAVKNDGEVCGREKPCQYHSD